MFSILLLLQAFAVDLKAPTLKDAEALVEKKCPKFTCSTTPSEKCLDYEDKTGVWTHSPCKEKFECPSYDSTFFDKKAPQTCKNATTDAKEKTVCPVYQKVGKECESTRGCEPGAFCKRAKDTDQKGVCTAGG
jgi:hypothetical protein